jgi:medium-chain acyl-[acyl-carrier-protein] hydrolase
MYSPWREYLPPGIELWPIEPPGRGVRLSEPPYSSIRPMVDDLATALQPWLDLPLAIFGHSLGARVAFELARCLRNRFRATPVHLFAAGQTAPHAPLDRPPVHAQPRDEFLVSLRRFGTPQEVLDNHDLLQIFEPLLRADFAAYETYQFQPERPLECPITALGGVEDQDVRHSELQEWRHHTASSHTVRMFPGGHYFVNTARPLVIRSVLLELENEHKERIDICSTTIKKTQQYMRW